MGRKSRKLARTEWKLPAMSCERGSADRTVVRELAIEPDTLAWYADRHGFERRVRTEALRHYRYRWESKRSGGVRLIESPKPRLKEIQRILLRRVLDRVPPHTAAHGFRRFRSIRTAVAPHVGKHTVLRVDLRDFFSSISGRRVHGLFSALGYDLQASGWLTGLCTNRAPAWVLDDCPEVHGKNGRHQVAVRYGRVHLPQGAPCSPAIANLCAWGLDVRLSSLADATRADYTRYGDDLLFSGGEAFGRAVRRFHVHVCAIIREEGLTAETRKTRIMRRSARQQGLGVVLNERPGIRRDAYDRLKATLHNCVQQGPATQNREGHPDFRAHLAGRLAHVESLHPQRGSRLRDLFEKIDW